MGFLYKLFAIKCYNIRKSIAESELMIMCILIFNIFIVVMGAAGIIKMSEDPLRTGYTLIALLASWDVLRNYIRQHNDK